MKKNRSWLLALALLFAGCGENIERTSQEGMRIIALAPSITEILFELGLGDQVAGISRFTVYPPEALHKPSVGGTYDPNWERIIALQPDLVVGLDTQKDIRAQLDILGIRFLGVAHERIEDILQSILIIGRACGAEEKAEALFRSLENRLESLSSPNKTGSKKPRVLVCVGHDESVSRIYAAGKGTLYDDLIERAGGVNACGETAHKYPEISREGLVVMRPDIILVIAPDRSGPAPAQWNPFHTVYLTNDYVSIPGPRFVFLLKDMQNAIRNYSTHPEKNEPGSTAL